MKIKIRTVIWDCDMVMWFHKIEQAQIIAKALNISDIDEFKTEFFGMIECFNVYFANKRVTLNETYKLIEKQMPILYFSGKSAKCFMDIMGKLKLEINEFNKDTLIVMKYLKEKGIRQIVKSDWWRDVQINLLKEYGILDYLEKVYCCDNEYLKCNPLSAKKIIRAGKEDNFIIIGDSIRSDIVFAEHAKIKSIWFNREKNVNTTSHKPDFEIASLLEVMDII